jgi:hypothetical protein
MDPYLESQGCWADFPFPFGIPIPMSPWIFTLFSQTFDLGPYGDLIKYAAPLELPLAPQDRLWAEELDRELIGQVSTRQELP